MFERDELERFLDLVYATAAGETSWDQGLHDWTRLFSAHGATMIVHDSRVVTDVHSFYAIGDYGIAPDKYYQSELFRTDPRMPLLKRVPAGTVYYDANWYDVDELQKHETVRAANDTVGIKYSLGLKFALPHDTIVSLAMVFTEKQGHATPDAIRTANRLLPHVERALSIGFLAEVDALTKTALLDALARKADGIILLGDDGAPTFLNDKAASILQQQDGLSLSNGTITAQRSGETKRLAQLIAQAMSPSIGNGSGCGGKMLVARPSLKLPFLVSVSPTPGTERFLTARRIAAVVQIIDLDVKEEVSKRDLREVFGLTEREADLAVELHRLGDLEQAATAANMAFNTARNHLHSMFFKLGVHDQGELKRVIGRVL